MWEEIFTGMFKQAYSQRSFSANFGVSPAICCWLWAKINHDPSFKPKHLLYALNFLKTGNTFDTLATRFQVVEKTIRIWVWKVIANLYDELDEVLSPPPAKYKVIK